MTIKDYIDKHKKSLDMFKQIILIKDGDFIQYRQSYFTLNCLSENYGQCELWNASVRNGILFLYAESTDKPRGGITLHTYLMKHNNVLRELAGVVLWFKSKKIIYAPNELNEIYRQGYKNRIIKKIIISRDLYIHLRIAGKANGAHFVAIGRSTSDKASGVYRYTKVSEQWIHNR